MKAKSPRADSLVQEPARLDLENVSVAYNGRMVLTGITCQIPHAARVAVVGPNGAGKSTLFKALVGLLPIQSGRIMIHGLPLGHHQDCVAYVPQREEVDWRFPLTVLDVVSMGRFRHRPRFGRVSDEDRNIVWHSLEQMAIADLARRSIGELSGGQQQRVFLARALAQEPHILLMDEPFTGVDATTQESTLALLEQLKVQEVTVMVSTHDLNMAAQRFELTLLINRHLIAYGPATEVFTPRVIGEAFGGQVFFMEDGFVVDRCCSEASEEARVAAQVAQGKERMP
jgi:ABC-type Mn2+/Zn2+ transport system ATPase subunit